ncbi:MAG: HAMP domain-containing protein [Caldithrix sp.]|nr:HAMP domain-containing protein [Caldithrix sp.]
MLKSLKARFIVITIILFFLVLELPLLIVMNLLRNDFNKTYETLFTTTIEFINQDIRQMMSIGEPHNIQTHLKEFNKISGIHRINIIDVHGRISYSSVDSLLDKSIADIPGHSFAEKQLQSKKIQLAGGNTFHSAYFPIQNTPRCQTCHDPARPVIGYIDVDLERIKAKEHFEAGINHTLFAGIAMAVILILILITLFSRFVNRPLLDLISAMGRVEEGSFDIQLKPENTLEMKNLQQKFLNMVKELKQNREQIEEYHLEQLHRADRLVTLGELTSELAHEINNPLGIISARVDYLKTEMEDRPGFKEFNDDFDTVNRQVEKLSRITRSILRYSRKLPKNFRAVNLNEMIQESIKVLEPRLEKFSIQTKLDLKQKSFMIWAESIQIEQVLANLINNAIDASPKKGIIEIRCKSRETGGRKEILLSITDFGSGMNDEEILHIFEPFYTTKPVGRGTGLGLYIVKNILHNHGADIECQSVPDEGTTFNIIFQEYQS